MKRFHFTWVFLFLTLASAIQAWGEKAASPNVPAQGHEATERGRATSCDVKTEQRIQINTERMVGMVIAANWARALGETKTWNAINASNYLDPKAVAACIQIHTRYPTRCIESIRDKIFSGDDLRTCLEGQNSSYSECFKKRGEPVSAQ